MKCTLPAVETLRKTIDAIKGAVAKSDERPILQQLELVVNGDKLTITALDGFVMTQRSLDIENGEDGTCIVNPAMLLNVIRGAYGFVGLNTQNNKLHVELVTSEHILPLCERQYLNHAKIWPDYDNTCSIYIDATILIKALQTLTKGGATNTVRPSFDAKSKLAPVLISMECGNRGLASPLRVAHEW